MRHNDKNTPNKKPTTKIESYLDHEPATPMQAPTWPRSGQDALILPSARHHTLSAPEGAGVEQGRTCKGRGVLLLMPFFSLLET